MQLVEQRDRQSAIPLNVVGGGSNHGPERERPRYDFRVARKVG